jgi:lipid-A-disaccharide synthase
MAAAGVDLLFDLTTHAVTGISDVAKHLWKFRRLFLRLLRLAVERQPAVIVCVDFSGFNRRFAHAIRRYARKRSDWFRDWNPKIIQYVSPQVWASRPARAIGMADDYDLLLCLLPFEKAWYASHAPRLNVEFVGHPIVERHVDTASRQPPAPNASAITSKQSPRLLLLPGSRRDEVRRHLPAMLGALARLQTEFADLQAEMVLPNETLMTLARPILGNLQLHGKMRAGLIVRSGELADALSKSDVAIASTGTVTLECAFYGVPTVAIYKTSWPTHEMARHMITVNYLALPNLLADEIVFPELIQSDASPEKIADAAANLLRDTGKRTAMQQKLKSIVASLGPPGASNRAARAILATLNGN